MPDDRPTLTASAGDTATRRHSDTATSCDPLWDDWEQPPRVPVTSPIVHLDGYDGPMDLLLDLAERQRIDLGRLDIAALAEQFVVAMQRLAAAVPINRRADWLVLATRLVQLRSQVLLTASPEEKASAQQAAVDAEAQLLERLRLRAAADWLEARPQLGRDVFQRPVPPQHREGGLLDLLEGVLLVMDGPRRPAVLPDTYRPALFRGWPVSEARARILALLPGSGEVLLPLLACLPDDDPEPEASSPVLPDPTHRQRRIRISSLFSAALELAKEGAAHIEQHEAGPLLSGRPQDAEAA